MRMTSYAPAWLGPRLPMLIACWSALRVTSSCRIVDPAAAAADGCAVYANDTCQAYARCGDAFIAPFGSIAACNQQLAQACTSSLEQPDVVGSGAGAAA
ncbi:MAG TPA: hypothetical protein VGI70_06230, partial [Polyangiales bacterium]